MIVGVIDYGMGNLGSVLQALSYLEIDNRVIDTPKLLADCSHVILPGVGSFGTAKYNLNKNGFDDALKSFAQAEKPILGICLGMQMFAEIGFENGSNDGLGLIQGKVVPIVSCSKKFRIPHVGWNSAVFKNPSPLLKGVVNGSDFYFVHSFHFDVSDNSHVLATTDHGTKFASIVARDNIFGTQFHPEKSSANGLKILSNFCKF
jgi:glutamine amidotransferase